MKASALVYVTGEAPRALKSNKTGKEFFLYSVYVKGSAPFPEKVSIFDNPNLPAGYYNVPYSLGVENERIKVNFDFSAATKAEQK